MSIGLSFASAIQGGYNSGGAKVFSSVIVPNGSVVFVPCYSEDSAAPTESVTYAVTNSGTARTWTQLALLASTDSSQSNGSRLGLYYWRNNTGSSVTMTITVTTTFVSGDNKYVGSGPIFLLDSGAADPAVTVPQIVSFQSQANAAQSITPATVGSQVVEVFALAHATATASSYTTGSQASTSPASVVYSSGETLVFGTAYRTANESTSGSPITVGPSLPGTSYATGWLIEFKPSGGGGGTATLSDSVPVATSLGRAASAKARATSDSVPVATSLTRTAGAKARATSDSVPVATVLVGAKVIPRAIADSVPVATSLGHTTGVQARALTNTVSLGTALGATTFHARQTADTVSVATALGILHVGKAIDKPTVVTVNSQRGLVAVNSGSAPNYGRVTITTPPAALVTISNGS